SFRFRFPGTFAVKTAAQTAHHLLPRRRFAVLPGQQQLAGRGAFLRAATKVLATGERTRWAPIVAVFRVVERDRITARFGRGGFDRVFAQVITLLSAELAGHEQIGSDGA